MSDVLVIDTDASPSTIDLPTDVLVFDGATSPVLVQEPDGENFLLFDAGAATSTVTTPQDFLLIDAPAPAATVVSEETGQDVVLITTGGPAGPQGVPGSQGPVGPQGPPGLGTVESLAFTFNQDAPSQVWDIVHPLSFMPNVTILDSAGTRVEGDARVLSPSHIQIEFSAPFSGVALLS